MPGPTLNPHGWLDPGLHPMSLAEVEDLFGRFQRTDRRPTLMARLRSFAAEAWAVNAAIQLIVDGSFVMARIDDPGDVDLAMLLPPDWDFAADLRPFEYNVVSRRSVRKRHGFDLLIGVVGQPSAEQAVAFFAQVNVKWLDPLGLPPDTLKGLVRVTP